MEIIDKLNEKQVVELTDIYQNFFKEIDFDNEYNDKTYKSLSYRTVNLAKINQSIDKKFYFAVEGEKVVGFIYGRIVDNVGLICNVYVSEENRNTFVHSALVKQILAWFKSKGIDTIEVEVHEKNPILNNFFSNNWNLLEKQESYNVFQRKI